MLAKLIVFFSMIIFTTSGAIAQDAKGKVAEENGETAADLLKVLPSDIVIGNEKAPVTIIEYASLSCSHCASFHNNTLDALNEKYIETGKVKFIFRDFPLDEPALRGAMMARCAGREGKEKFMKFTKVMFSTQSNWAPKKNYLEILSNIGKLGGMKGEDFELCIADTKLEKSIIDSKFKAVNILDVRSTPTFFVNGVMHKGARDFEYFSEIIDSILGVPNKKSKEE